MSPTSTALKSFPSVSLPNVPVLAVNAREVALLTQEGELVLCTHEKARMISDNNPVLACHIPYTRHRLGAKNLLGFDLLELFAFVHPAKFCVPTPTGLCNALGLKRPDHFEDYPMTLMEIAQTLLSDLQKAPRNGKTDNPAGIARVMGLQGKGWNWTPFVLTALGEEYNMAEPITPRQSLNVWRNLPEWAEEAPPPPPGHYPVTGEESRARLAEILLNCDHASEPRPQQQDYTTAMTAAFAPKQEEDELNLIIAEAGTGVGKTAGYLAPATVWSEKNDGSVWVSTYTKNLQRQISRELDRFYPDPDYKENKVAIRKGRENYLCLLNLEDTVAGAAMARHPNHAIAAGLMARWAAVTADGDLQGGDFPGWLPGLLGYSHTQGLADKRGECIYSACTHYHKCFVEKAARKSQRADIVVANHALVMIQTAMATAETVLPQRYIFDEGHHLFHAADSAFAAHLTARETADLRRWLLGPEGNGHRSRARGLKRRAEDLVAGDDEADADLQAILQAAHALAGPGWSKRLKENQPHHATEHFLSLVYKQVMARASGRNGQYSLETDTHPLIDELPPVVEKLKTRLRALQKPMRSLSGRLRKMLADNAETWDSDTRRRVEAVCAGLDRRSEYTVGAWIAMLESLLSQQKEEQYVDWMEIERIEGRTFDVGLYRHWVDPLIPFASAIKPHAHGLAITSATLRDRSGQAEDDWLAARQKTGADYLSTSPVLFDIASPYDYASQTKVFIVGDVRKEDMAQVAAAYSALFKAANGGALGLFTAIQRLRDVQERISRPLEEAGIPLYAQHIDMMDTGTLVDVFREDHNACLLGTDAVRDGIDVPGDSLRLLVYDRVPWPRPTILHKNRRNALGGRKYDERLTRMKLRQAYGRLVRRANDRGVFVMLDSRLPTRLLTAFPEGVTTERLGLAEIVSATREFLKT